jgi:hypothetical protein
MSYVELHCKDVGIWFKELPSIKEIVVGDEVENIGTESFKRCTGLITATVNNHGSIGNRAFVECSELKDISLGANITSIGNKAFAECSKLENIEIQNAVSIGESAFQECTSLASVKLGDGVQTIGVMAFKSCSALTEIQLGKAVTTIDKYAFEECSSLSSIQIPASVTAINNSVFSGCISLKTIRFEDGESELTLGNNDIYPLFSGLPLESVYIGRNLSYESVSAYNTSPFCQNMTLRSVIFNDMETEITTKEFIDCVNLKEVTIGNGVKTIGEAAFSGCRSLETLSFGTSVETIGKNAFADCTAMNSLTSHATIPPVCGVRALEDINKETCQLIIPEGTKSSYEEAEQWKEFFNIEEEGTGILPIRNDNYDKYTVYTLDGKRMEKPQKGINIIRMSDGTTKKVVVK